MLRRLAGWDYKGRAIYQITVTLAERGDGPLGRLEVRQKGSAQGWMAIGDAKRIGLAPEAIEARVVASKWGEAALSALAEMPSHCPAVELLAVRLMPDHIHFIIFVKEPIQRPLGALIRGFKAGASARWKALYSAENGRAQDGAENGRAQDGAENGRAQGGAENGRAQGGAENGRAQGGAENGRAQGGAENGRAQDGAENGRAQDGAENGWGGAGPVPTRSRVGPPGWAEGFQDTVLLHAGQLANMKHYLADNARRLAVKRLCPAYFHVVRELSLPLAFPEGTASGRFAALGNRFPLSRPLVQVQVSRRDFGYRREPKPGGGMKIVRDAAGAPVAAFATREFEGRKTTFLAAARHGAVLIAPCVSDGERQIAREALAAELPLVTLTNKGFAPLAKPSGRLFDACASGRLLVLAPAAWPYQPGEKPMTREDATAMNRLAQLLAGEGAATIRYHGLMPANIDALARQAAGLAKGEP